MIWSDKNIIFLISLPRAGSTLLQRILSAHPDIHSTAESWILLPQFYSARSGDTFSEYGHTHAAGALEDFFTQLPSGEFSYFQEVSKLAIRLFKQVTPESKNHYLEKTPRNALIVDDLLTHFPNSKFIFLWRNPVACASSIIETFGHGRWNLYKYVVDLYDAVDKMTRAATKHQDRIVQVQYEKFLANPESTIETLLKSLDLEYTQSLVNSFNEVSLNGRMGDPTGIKAYSTLSKQPLEKWKSTLTSPIRLLWAKRYLAWLGENRLSVMGYNRSDIENELKQIRPTYRTIGSDLLRMTYGALETHAQAKMFRHLIRTRKTREFGRRYF